MTDVAKVKEQPISEFLVVQIRTREGWVALGLLGLMLVGIGLCFYFHQYLAAWALLALMTVWGLLSVIIAIIAYVVMRAALFLAKYLVPRKVS